MTGDVKIQRLALREALEFNLIHGLRCQDVRATDHAFLIGTPAREHVRAFSTGQGLLAYAQPSEFPQLFQRSNWQRDPDVFW
jgi:hypothetical protein